MADPTTAPPDGSQAPPVADTSPESPAGPAVPKVMDRLAAVPAPDALAPLVTKMIAGPCHVSLHADRVTRVDTVALQLLLAMGAHQAAQACAFQIDAPSAAWTHDLALFGLSPDLTPLERH